MTETALKRCAVCQNWSHCTSAGYCNCGAYSVRQETAGMQIASVVADTVSNYLSVSQRKADKQTLAALEIIGALKRAGFHIVEGQTDARQDRN